MQVDYYGKQGNYDGEDDEAITRTTPRNIQLLPRIKLFWCSYRGLISNQRECYLYRTNFHKIEKRNGIFDKQKNVYKLQYIHAETTDAAAQLSAISLLHQSIEVLTRRGGCVVYSEFAKIYFRTVIFDVTHRHAELSRVLIAKIELDYNAPIYFLLFFLDKFVISTTTKR